MASKQRLAVVFGLIFTLAYAGTAWCQSLKVTSNASTSALTTLYGDSTQNINLCVSDAIGDPLRGIKLYFYFYDLSYFGQVNGQYSGNYTPPTGANGCVPVTIVTWGIQPTPPTGSPDDYVRFSFLYQGTESKSDYHFIVNDPTISLSTSQVASVPATVTATLTPPLQSIRLVGSCQGTNGPNPSASPSPVITNANGVATVTVNSDHLEVAIPNGPQPTASCTFKTQTGGIHSATLTFKAVNVCTIGLSPPDPRCG